MLLPVMIELETSTNSSLMIYFLSEPVDLVKINRTCLDKISVLPAVIMNNVEPGAFIR